MSLALFGVGSLLLLGNVNEVDSSMGLRRTSVVESSRPVMHTFYEDDGGNDQTGEGELRLIEAWKESWESAGWDTKVLRMADAERHPDFEKYEAILRNSAMSEYNKLCYFRWIAMAANGGGWMSDMDTFPLEQAPEQPQAPGRFTAHGHTVPCLLSGSRLEWERMTKAMLKSSSEHQDDRRWTDMTAMKNLYEEKPKLFTAINEIAAAQTVFNNLPVNEELCEKVRGKKAIHFSHKSIDDGMKAGAFDDMSGVVNHNDIHKMLDQRGEIARELVGSINEVCAVQSPR